MKKVVLIIMVVVVFVVTAGTAVSAFASVSLEEKVGALLEEPMPTLTPTGKQPEGQEFWLELNAAILLCAAVVFVIYTRSHGSIF